MPELPEVDALVGFLRTRAVGERVERADLAELSLLKTYDPPLTALVGRTVDDVSRVGKALILTLGDLELVCRLARAGWLVWHDRVPATAVRMGRGPLGLRVSIASGAGFDLREAGTTKNASVALVHDRHEVPAVAQAGPDAGSIDAETFAAALGGTRARIKNALVDHRLLAGIGNAYSDEILHVARLSPFAPAHGVDPDHVLEAMRGVLGTAREALEGLPPAQIKAAKKRGLRVHGRAGEPCPVCGTTIAEVSYADTSLQYCPTCQTGGRRLSDRRMDRLLR